MKLCHIIMYMQPYGMWGKSPQVGQTDKSGALPSSGSQREVQTMRQS